MAYQVLIRYPDGQQLDFQFDKDVVVIGRVEGCDIRLAHAFVSSRHLRLQRQAGSYFVQDLGSTNGTLVNGKALEPRVPQSLGPSDRIQLGSLDITVEPIVDATIIERTPLLADLPDAKTFNEPAGLPLPSRPRAVSTDIPIDAQAPMWQLQTGMIDLRSGSLRIDDQVVSQPRAEMVATGQRPDFEASLLARRAQAVRTEEATTYNFPVGLLVQGAGALMILGGLAVLVAILVL